MDLIKESFQKVKQDIDFLFTELQEIKRTLEQIKDQQTNKPTNQHINTTNQHKCPTPNTLPTQIPTHKLPLEASKTSIFSISTGNEGVPTNQPTNQQTNQHPLVSLGKPIKTDKISQLKKVSKIIESLDELKKEVRIKFKQLTEQEMAIFSSIYQLEEQGLLVDYALLAEKFNLSEISIRDYIRKIIKKGVEINKIKQNNKKVILSIPTPLKKIASLQTILQLREL